MEEKKKKGFHYNLEKKLKRHLKYFKT